MVSFFVLGLFIGGFNKGRGDVTCFIFKTDVGPRRWLENKLNLFCLSFDSYSEC